VYREFSGQTLREKKRNGSLDNGYLDNFNNGFSNKYEKNLKVNFLWICYSIYGLIVIQILCNFIIV
jgi:hypothetical protein